MIAERDAGGRARFKKEPAAGGPEEIEPARD